MPTLREGLDLDRPAVVSLVGAGGKTTLMFRLAEELSRAGETVLTTTTTKIFRPTPQQSPRVILARSPEELLSRVSEQRGGGFHFTAAAGESAATDNAAVKLTGYPPEAVARLWASGLFRWILVEADGAAGRGLKMAAAHEPVIPEVSACVVIVAGLDVLGRPLEERWVFRSRLYGQVTGLAPGQAVSERSLAEAVLSARGLARGSPPGARRHLFLNKADNPSLIAAGRRVAGLLRERPGEAPERVVLGRAAHDPPVLEWLETGPGRASGPAET